MKNKFLIFILVLLIGSISYYFYIPSIDDKDMVYFESAKDSIIKNHEYFMTHHVGQSVNSSDKIVFTKQRDNFRTNENYFDLLKKRKEIKLFLIQLIFYLKKN